MKIICKITKNSVSNNFRDKYFNICFTFIPLIEPVKQQMTSTSVNKVDIKTETRLQPTKGSVTSSSTVLQCTPDPRNYTFITMVLYCG